VAPLLPVARVQVVLLGPCLGVPLRVGLTGSDGEEAERRKVAHTLPAYSGGPGYRSRNYRAYQQLVDALRVEVGRVYDHDRASTYVLQVTPQQKVRNGAGNQDDLRVVLTESGELVGALGVEVR
jgi:hypothetical protein